MEAVTAQCAKHHFDPAVAVCGQCGLTFCPACLVYAFGADKPPFCIPCALTVGGVRRGGAVAKVSWRERRARRKALETQQVAAASPVAEPVESYEPAESYDWDSPFESTAFAD